MTTLKETANRKFESYNFPAKIESLSQWLEQQGLTRQENTESYTGTRTFWFWDDTIKVWSLQTDWPIDFLVIARPFCLEIYKEGFYPATVIRLEFETETIPVSLSLEEMKEMISDNLNELLDAYNP